MLSPPASHILSFAVLTQAFGVELLIFWCNHGIALQHTGAALTRVRA